MNLILKNTDFIPEGIFGEILDDSGNHLFYTLQHAYDSGLGNGSYEAKVKSGEYNCVRGMHQLTHMISPFETFEITGVVGHTNILFHKGNYNNDSEGCVLLGMDLSLHANPPCITRSANAFDKFIELQKGLNNFKLTVRNV